MELLRRYSNLDTVQKTVRLLRDSGALTPDGRIQVPLTPRFTADPPEPFKLSQRLKPDTIAEIVARYEAGEPSTALAAAVGISKGSVIRLLRNAGVCIRNQGLSVDQIAEAISLYANGKSLAYIGEHFGVDHGTVWRQLRKRGVKMRDTHGRET
ncbi:helix-turn-helix domain-containing protein [Mycobacteroides abscessus]|uniref:helix-turn-helix domain-containing protein n=1 Tax=Mycobacteroides abscessus TaxID=36809 RepID=UPI00266DB7F1|nr:helix-turn-helix domain-containing protein [Mycobacteroides abscessus]MDO3175911.1 helix-turn-helix domain-containing protein [Mycobacteroides abscessus subsp. abscessus]